MFDPQGHLLAIDFSPDLPRVQSTASLGVQVMVLPLNSSILDCLMAVMLHKLPHTGQVAIWSSGGPRISAPRLGLRHRPWMIRSCDGVVRILTQWRALVRCR